MRVVAQRVSSGEVTVAGERVGAVGPGLVAYLGVGARDTGADVAYIVGKIAGLRVFEDDDGRMSLSALDVGGEVLLISQFTLYGDMRRGRRPSFTDAAEPTLARALYEDVAQGLRAAGLTVATGRFQATMSVSAVVEGPVTILIDSEKTF